MKSTQDSPLSRAHLRFLLINVILALFITVMLLLPYIIGHSYNLSEQVDGALVNGVLTATAITFGFLNLEITEIKVFHLKYLLVLILLMFLMTTVLFYFNDCFEYGRASKLTMLVATANFLFNIFCYPIVMSIKHKTNIPE
jgi:ABC-type transport system involved in cytochrome c biogenesis permease subunit